MYGVDRGVQTDDVLTFGIRASEKYSPARRWALAGPLLDRLNVLPGIVSASAVDVLPISGSLWARDVQVEGYTFRRDESEETAFSAIAPKYFATVGTPLLRGREFDERDTGIAKKVAIVSESFAHYFFGAQSPLGRRVISRDVAYEIVGVAKNAKYTDLRQGILKTMYIPWTQREGEEPSDYNFVVRVKAGDPMRLAPTLEKLVQKADPGLWLRLPQAYSAVVDRSIATERIMATLGSFFGLLALIVACLGIFGATAFQVSRRTNELGVRMALGSSQTGIVMLVMRDVAAMLAAGCLIGAGGALCVTGLTRSMLFEVTPTDPRMFAIAAAVLGVGTFAAGWLPARRASRFDPMAALRHE